MAVLFYAALRDINITEESCDWEGNDEQMGPRRVRTLAAIGGSVSKEA